MKSIEELRKELNMSLKEFSEYYEIPYNTVRQWEKGERTPPNYIIKLLNEVINLKAKGIQLNIENFTNKYCYEYYKNNGLAYRAFCGENMNEDNIEWFNKRQEDFKQNPELIKIKIFKMILTEEYNKLGD